MKKEKKKVLKRTTCNVLIRAFPVELSEKLKEYSQSKTLSKALIISSRAFLQLLQDHDKLQAEQNDLKSLAYEMDSGISSFIQAFETLKGLSKSKKGGGMDIRGVPEKDEFGTNEEDFSEGN